jgi:hypothetical protein
MLKNLIIITKDKNDGQKKKFLSHYFKKTISNHNKIKNRFTTAISELLLLSHKVYK